MWSTAKKRAKPVYTELKNLNNKLTELDIFLGDRLNKDINFGSFLIKTKSQQVSTQTPNEHPLKQHREIFSKELIYIG